MMNDLLRIVHRFISPHRLFNQTPEDAYLGHKVFREIDTLSAIILLPEIVQTVRMANWRTQVLIACF